MIFFELFYTFFLIGLFTFGGGYAMIPLISDNVISKGWLTEAELSDFIAISEVTPGPFAINVSTFVGSKVGGVFGAVCSTLGVVLPSFIIILIIAIILTKILKNRFVKSAINSVKPVVLALILSTTIVLFVKLVFFNNQSFKSEFIFDVRSFTLLIMLLGFEAIYMYKKKKSISPILLICFSAILGVIIFI